MLVAERFPWVEPEMGERHLVRIVLKANPSQIGNPVVLAMNAEAMQVLTTPNKGNLNIVMELGDAGLAGKEQSSPDDRADSYQHSAQLVVVDGCGSWVIPGV
jgi:hypothetical protein